MISHPVCRKFQNALGVAVLLVTFGMSAHSQASYPPSNDLPNPYKTVQDWAKLPDGRKWGGSAGVAISPEGNIWTYERCGGTTCAKSDVAPILEFDPSGKLLESFGAGMFVFPHGLSVDKEGNVWVTDGVGGTTVPDDAGKHGKGHQIFKFSPDGKVLLVLGKAGVPGNGPDTFNRPSAVAIAPNGDIFVADGHRSPPGSMTNSRIVKFSKDGKFIKEWTLVNGKPGTEGPHDLAFDSKGRLFVADRSNSRIQIFDQDGKFLMDWKQFGRPSGIYIDKNDNMYVADSESTDENTFENNPGVKRGIRVGSARDGKVIAFIPDPSPGGTTSGAEGIAADAQGNIYGAEVTLMDVKKYVKN